jgi:hypothetical protein
VITAVVWRALLCIIGLAAIVGTGLGAEPDLDRDAKTKAHQDIEVRRVWVLSEPDGYGYGSGSRTREIVVYELVCEQGKITKMSEGFVTGSGPKFGEGWVLRTRAAPSAEAAQEELQLALADICGI